MSIRGNNLDLGCEPAGSSMRVIGQELEFRAKKGWTTNCQKAGKDPRLILAQRQAGPETQGCVMGPGPDGRREKAAIGDGPDCGIEDDSGVRAGFSCGEE